VDEQVIGRSGAIFIATTAALGGCHTASIDRPARTTSKSPAVALAPSPPPPPQSSRPARTFLGYSILNRPIEIEYFGSGPVSVLILGGIHGDEVTSVDVARNLATLLRENPKLIPPGRRIGIIEVANPDGYFRRTRSNARGIDVNRNFPAKNFAPGGGRAFRGGKSPASEPETRAILTAMDALRPRLVISIHSIRGENKQQNNYDGPASAVAELMRKHNGYPVTPTIGYPTPGSLGSYAGGDLKIPIITLELPRAQPGEAAWRQNRDALLAAIGW
jgi:protein MpaA